VCYRAVGLSFARGSLSPGWALSEPGLPRLQLCSPISRRVREHVIEQRLPSMIVDHQSKITYQ
jgi:hypothetical protein